MTTTLLPSTPELDPMSLAKEYAAVGNRLSLLSLVDFAVENDWPASDVTVLPDFWGWDLTAGKSAGQHPKSLRSGGENHWFRVTVASKYFSDATMDLQPLFQPNLEPNREGDPLFVRVYGGPKSQIANTLNYLLPDSESNGLSVLRRFILPLEIDLEAVTFLQPPTPVDSQPQTV